MNCGYLALVLHAHLPYVRHPEHEDFLEEGWLYEALTEAYLPLLRILEDLVSDGIDFRLTLSLTPTLVSMLNDDLLRARSARHLDMLCDLAEKEVSRTRTSAEFHDTALMYLDRFTRERRDYHDRWNRDLVSAFVRLQRLGKVEIIASAATHGFLPLLRANPLAVRAQVVVGMQHHAETTGCRPAGMWLPECGFYPGLDAVLKEAGIRYFFVDTHGIDNASSKAEYGVYAPLYCPSGVAAFGRDPESAKQVWSSIEGYPGDPLYREFYRDIGFDLDFNYIKPYIQKDGFRTATGIKYYRVTGPTDNKMPYRRESALRRAELDAADFLSRRRQQAEKWTARTGRAPIIVAPYDAELFGHWWFEGPEWIDFLIRKTASENDSLRLITASEYLDRFPVNQTEMPGCSSWGFEGYNRQWLNSANDWLYPHLHAAADRMVDLACWFPDAQDVKRRALNQAARELLLAQASDWAFIMAQNSAVGYAERRSKDHLFRFNRLYEMLRAGSVDESWLRQIELADNIFPSLDYTVYLPDGKPAVALDSAVREQQGR